MSGSAQRARATVLVAAGFMLVAGAGMGLAALAGFAAAPSGVAAVLTLVAASSVGWAAAPLVRAAHAAARGVAPKAPEASGPAESPQGPESPTGPATTATGPATNATEPATNATGPATSATGPATSATGPATGDRGPQPAAAGSATGRLTTSRREPGPETAQPARGAPSLPETARPQRKTRSLTEALHPAREARSLPATARLAGEAHSAPRTARLAGEANSVPQTARLAGEASSVPRTDRLAGEASSVPRTGRLGDEAHSSPETAQPARKVPRSHRRPSLASPIRTAVVAGAVLVLGIVCWLQPGEPGRVLFGVVRAAVGLLVYAVPLVPLLALVPTGPRTAVAWGELWQGLRRERKALAPALAVARVTRDSVLGRGLGFVLATVALLHLLRGRPGLEESAYQLAGGLLGIVAATPLAGVFSVAGAFGLLLAVLAGVATVTAGHLYRPLGRYPALAALVLLLVAPVVAGGVSNRVGYRHFLGADGDRVVVIAGLSPHHRHETYPAGVGLADLPAPLHPVLRKGFPVADRDDGARVAAALADPAKAAVDGFPDGGLTLRAGECFSFVGGTSNFRYTVPCNGEHTGEVFYVGRLPFTRDPGTDVRTAAARGACEKAYGGYLGAPYGTSYLPIEPPVVQRDLVACLFAALGPWPLKGTRTVATLHQPLDWSPEPGCAVEAGTRFAATQPGRVCVAPGRAVTAAGTAPIVVDAEFQPVGRGAGNGRVGVACVSGDAASGYYATVGGDGVLTLVKRQGSAQAQLGAAGKARSSPSPQTVVTPVQLTCRPAGADVQLVASAGKGRELTLTDAQGITTLSPRLVVEAAEAPISAAVTLFTAKVV